MSQAQTEQAGSSGLSTTASSSGGVGTTVVEDELLDYQDPLEGDDITIVEGAVHVERTLQTLAKRDGIRGLFWFR